MPNKPFDQKLHADNDDAKYIIIDWLNTQGYDAEVNPDTYGIDLLAVKRKTGQTFGFEVEVKHNWRGRKFPFSTVHFASRKLKFAKEEGTFFVMLDTSRKYALIINGSALVSASIITKPTKYTKQENFVEIPLEKFALVALEEKDG